MMKPKIIHLILLRPRFKKLTALAIFSVIGLCILNIFYTVLDYSRETVRDNLDLDYVSLQHLFGNKRTRGRGCVVPKLNQNNKEMMNFFQVLPPVDCGDGFDWVTLQGGKFIIESRTIEKYRMVNCHLTTLERKTDFETVVGEIFLDVKNGTSVTNDFFKVECTSADGRTYRNYHAGIHQKLDVVNRKKPTSQKGLDLDVIIIGQDSLSHVAWKRHLPLTRKYLVETLGVTEMKGFSVVGDGTPASLFPLLTGNREEDLPEARKGYEGSKPMDDFPWIWKDFRKAGYVTTWLEDEPSIGVFHYRLQGFASEPVDHYYRRFALYVNDNALGSLDEFCLGAKPNVVSQLAYARGVFDVYPEHRKWAFAFRSESSHNNNNEASQIDKHFLNELKHLHGDGHLDNALLVVMADHGARFSQVRAFAQGKLEERMPYLAIRLPEKFKARYPEISENLKQNSEKLVTPFDLHTTLHEVIEYTGSGRADISKRGVSLFKSIPTERDCESADIDPHWCFCLEWFPVPLKDDVIRKGTYHVLRMLNRATADYRQECNLLTLKEVTNAFILKVKNDVLKFSGSKDEGRGRYGSMNVRTKPSRFQYQITFMTSPNNGLYEVTLSRDFKSHSFSTSLKSVSRINKYGDDPWCIVKKIPQIGPYCQCKWPKP